MEHQSFFPRSTRNRIALGLGFLSLVLFVTWNLMPYPKLTWRISTNESKCTAAVFWPKLPSMLNLVISNFRSDFTLVLFFVGKLATIILAITVFALLPAWHLLQYSFILRVIPAMLILIGCFSCVFVPVISSNANAFPLQFLIVANFLTTALSLLCFKNEWTEPETPL